MQLYANHQNGRLYSAWEAERQTDYACLECGGIVRLRGGRRRQLHFYHKELTHNCRQNGKTLCHLQVQKRLLTLLGSENCQLEKPFPTIGRIADVCWESEKMIFEVQCSSIDQSEVEARNKDYGSIGYDVVWIFHERRFNQPSFLEPKHHYFTDIDEEGQGIIYDTYGKSRFPIDPTQVMRNLNPGLEIPELLMNRTKSRSFYFDGDCIDQAMKGKLFTEFEARSQHNCQKRNLWRTYLQFFRLLLEQMNQQ